MAEAELETDALELGELVRRVVADHGEVGG
jgi:hypothetical protein